MRILENEMAQAVTNRLQVRDVISLPISEPNEFLVMSLLRDVAMATG